MLKKIHGTGVPMASPKIRKKKDPPLELPWKSIRSVDSAVGDVVLSRFMEGKQWIAVAEVWLMKKYDDLPIGVLYTVTDPPRSREGEGIRIAYLCRLKGPRASLVLLANDLEPVYEALGRVVPAAAIALCEKVNAEEGIDMGSMPGIETREELQEIVLKIAKDILNKNGD